MRIASVATCVRLKTDLSIVLLGVTELVLVALFAVAVASVADGRGTVRQRDATG